MDNRHATGRVVVITGAGGGVGAGRVARFQANGDTVIGTDVSTEALDELAAGVDAQPNLITVAANITVEDDVDNLAALVGKHGGLDILINCAGFFPFTAFAGGR